MDKKTPFNVYQARNAVRIAQAAGAETYAADGFKNAERLLALSETKAGGKRGRSKNARQAVQMAEDSRLLSVKLQEEERVVNAQQATQARVASAKNQVAAATAGQIQAETAQRLAEADAKLARASAVQAEGDKAVFASSTVGSVKHHSANTGYRARVDSQHVRHALPNRKRHVGAARSGKAGQDGWNCCLPSRPRTPRGRSHGQCGEQRLQSTVIGTKSPGGERLFGKARGVSELHHLPGVRRNHPPRFERYIPRPFTKPPG
jgi:hypothetical protein